MKIVVLAGGISTERDVSLITGTMIYRALKANGHDAILVDVFMGLEDEEGDISDIFTRWNEREAWKQRDHFCFRAFFVEKFLCILRKEWLDLGLYLFLNFFLKPFQKNYNSVIMYAYICA